MPNENCLQGMACPQCRSEGPFRIEVSMIVLMDDDGSDDDPMDGGQDWDATSYCECWACHFAGTVADFQEEGQEPDDIPAEDVERLLHEVVIDIAQSAARGAVWVLDYPDVYAALRKTLLPAIIDRWREEQADKADEAVYNETDDA